VVLRQNVHERIDPARVLQLLKSLHARYWHAQNLGGFTGCGESSVDSCSHLISHFTPFSLALSKNLGGRVDARGARHSNRAENRAGLKGQARPYDGNCKTKLQNLVRTGSPLKR
jgi:hypothetical protein